MDLFELYQLFLLHPVISTDSREISPGCIFFGIKGPTFNGNTFARRALGQGASLAVVDDPLYYGIDDIFVVDDSLKMLQALASLHRTKLNIPIIGITGSNGKTTTKELVKTVLETHYSTLFTNDNLNNHIGVPLTLLQIKPDTEIAVIEMGANHTGEIAELCEMVQPTLGILTNIGKAHLEGFGGLDGIILTKKALYESVRLNKGTVFVNAANHLLMELSKGTNRWTFGFGNEAVTQCLSVIADPFLAITYRHKQTTYQIHSKLLGDYNYENMMAAVCVGLYMGLDPLVFNSALETYTPANNRSQLYKTSENTIFLDAYNANPSSMQVAIDNFRKVKAEKKAIILGDMLELGEDSEAEHLHLIHSISEHGFSSVFLIGPYFQKMNDQKHYLVFPDAASAKDHFLKNPLQGYTILLKGSRGIALEIILDAL